MKITYAHNVEYPILTHDGCHCVKVADTFQEALDYVRDNWVEGEGFNVQIQAASRWERVTLCTITDDDPLDEVSPDNREIVKAVLTLLAKQK